MTILAWAILLLVAGILIVILEMFVPSSGMLGVLATMAIIGAIWLGYTHSVIGGTVILMVAAVLVPVILVAAVHLWPDTPIGRRMIIQPPTDEDVLPESDAKHTLAALIGKRGRARTEMLPGGSVDIDGRRYDAVSDSGAIEPGTAIVVVRLETRRLVVRIDETPITAMVLPIDPAMPTQVADVATAASSTPKKEAEEGEETKSPFEEPLI